MGTRAMLPLSRMQLGGPHAHALLCRREQTWGASVEEEARVPKKTRVSVARVPKKEQEEARGALGATAHG
jgi:hypothetical protein